MSCRRQAPGRRISIDRRPDDGPHHEKGLNRVKNQKFAIAGAVVLATLLAACGGGSGGSNPGVVPTSPTSTPAPAVQTLSGTVVDFAAGTPLAGFTVTVGTAPSVSSCLAAQTASSQPCGVPASTLPTVTTAADGTFSVTVPSAGNYMLQIAKDTAHATLHRIVGVIGATAIGSVKITALSSDEQAWLTDVNAQRATVSVPTSFANLVVDEYAEEQARADAASLLTSAYNDPTTGIPNGDNAARAYGALYAAMPGAMYGTAGVTSLNTLGQLGAFVGADNAWMSEKATCSGGNWQTCTFAANTGHYINVSNTQDVWIGMGETAGVDSHGYSYYVMLIPQSTATAGPASARRL
jgi:hypothetical protein